MGISVITVKSHKMMAYKELRKILAPDISTPGRPFLKIFPLTVYVYLFITVSRLICKRRLWGLNGREAEQLEAWLKENPRDKSAFKNLQKTGLPVKQPTRSQQ